MSWRINRVAFDKSELVKVGDAPPPDAPPLGVGDKCKITCGGGPLFMVVDILSDDRLVVSWNDDELRPKEEIFPRVVLRRVDDASRHQS